MTLTLALPSKGRLRDQALDLFARAGLAVELPADERKYRARLAGRVDIEVSFLSASEIAGELGLGSIDLGVTGEDLLRETLAEWDARRVGRADGDRRAPRLRPRRCGGRRAICLARRRHHG